MQVSDSTRTASRESPRSKASLAFDAERKQQLGQFLTPESIGAFMASLFAMHPREIRLLDAGAGDGALTAALVRTVCEGSRRPHQISVTAYEIDRAILPALQRTLGSCHAACERSGIQFSADLRNEEFIEAAVPLVRSDLFDAAKTPFNAAILNPPYRKINSDSHTRRLLREAGIDEQPLHSFSCARGQASL